MTPTVGYVWRLREVMASHGVWKTTDLGPLLAERGVVLSAAQVYRLAAQIPERLSLRTLAALCRHLRLHPQRAHRHPAGVGAGQFAGGGAGPARVCLGGRAGPRIGRPRRARVDPRS